MHTQPIGSLVSGAGAAACDLMTALCSWDPAKRPTAVQALQHPFFQVGLTLLHIWQRLPWPALQHHLARCTTQAQHLRHLSHCFRHSFILCSRNILAAWC